MLLGILGGQTPVITGMARQNRKEDGGIWSVAKKMYRLLGNKRLQTDVIYQGLYETGQSIVAGENAVSSDQEGSFPAKAKDNSNGKELNTRGCDTADGGGETVAWIQL